jgi:hypothetical protein
MTNTHTRPVKYIFVTGGVVSSLGKGLAAASIGALLEGHGYKVTLQKFDPYLNVDPGTAVDVGWIFAGEDSDAHDRHRRQPPIVRSSARTDFHGLEEVHWRPGSQRSSAPEQNKGNSPCSPGDTSRHFFHNVTTRFLPSCFARYMAASARLSPKLSSRSRRSVCPSGCTGSRWRRSRLRPGSVETEEQVDAMHRFA